MEELLLWRWSTAVQITSALMVAVFFLVVRRSTGRSELNEWTFAWQLNFAALAVTWLYWIGQPPAALVNLLTAAYLFCKTAFLIGLLAGVFSFAGIRFPRPPLAVAGATLVVLSVAAALLIDSIAKLGTLQASTIAVFMLAGAVVCLRTPGRALGWLGCGLLLRGLLALAEAGAYGSELWLPEAQLADWVGVFLAAHSSFDTGAEWVIVLGCVLTLAHRAQDELRHSHAELQHAHDELQRAVERDPLTGLYNRRMLGGLLRRAEADGGCLLFFDLDDFKRINDQAGHQTGDACLRRFADALRASFADCDGLLRYAGDEFLLLADRRLRHEVAQRLVKLRESLAKAELEVPAIAFSVGLVDIPPHGDAQAALREADAAMYAQKAARQRGSVVALG